MSSTPGQELALALTERLDAPDTALRDQGVVKYYRPDVDGLRAVAVIAVMLYHAGLPVTSGGYVGVDCSL